MSRQLAHTLVSDGIIKQTDVEEALQRQVLFGGSLGTNLLEAGVITEGQLLEALGTTYSLPVAGRAEIEKISAHIPRLFPQVFAESYHLVPFKLEGDSLGVLVTGRPDEQLLKRIQERLAVIPAPSVTSEVRLHYAMNQLYGADLLPRFKTLISKLDGVTVVHEPAATKPVSALSWGVSSGHNKPKPGTRVNLRELLARLEFATDRDTIVEILMTAVIALFDYAALFLVQGQTINGWRGADPISTARIARISLPVELPSVFQTIYATGGHYLGPLPTNSVNTKLLEDIGRKPPRAAFVAPMIIGDKLAMIVYADNGPGTISPRRVAAVSLLTQRASIAFERLIRKRKAAASHIMDSKTSTGDWEEDAPIEFDLAEETPVEEVTDVADHEYEVVTESPVPAPVPPAKLTAALSPGRDAWKDVSFGSIDQSPDATTAAFERSVEEHGGDVVDLDSDYVAFTDIDDDAEEALDGWGDVLVETASAMLGTVQLETTAEPAAERGPPPTVTWDAVIAEAAAAAELRPRSSSPIEVAGMMVDEKEIFFDGLLATDPQTRSDAVEKLLPFGHDTDSGITKRFPGTITFDPLDPKSKVPPFAHCSGITELILARGTSAASVVLPFLDHDDPVKRFFAIYFLLAVPYPKALDLLARRLYDTEPRSRHLAADALRMYTKEPGYQRVVQALRSQVKVPVLESRIAAVQLLGQLRDPACVPELIPLVVAPEQELSRAAASALAVVCAQEFAHDVPQWSSWWRSNYKRPRPVWLIEGLRHESVAMRRIANYELQLLTGMTTHYEPDASEEEREEKRLLWENWWMHLAKSQAAPAPVATTAGSSSSPPGR